ncbi:MAG: redoxin domain-containing protein [Ginsengibacter sp.]
MKKLLLLSFLFCSINSIAQDHFTFSPLQPKAGESVTVTYIPSGDLADTRSPIEAAVYTFSPKQQNAEDILLKKTNNSYIGTIQTDSSADFVYFSFSANGKYDTNNGDGYWFPLYENGQAKVGANLGLARFYGGLNNSVGIESPDFQKALNAYEEEFKLYPDSKKENLVNYLRTVLQVNKTEGASLVQKEIESLIKSGLKTEDNYVMLQNLYNLAKLPQQAGLINEVKKEKFPQGKWAAVQTLNQFMAEKDLSKKEIMLGEIISKINTDPDWKVYEQTLPFFKSSLIRAYVAKEDWEGMKNAVKKYNLSGSDIASLYNSVAWQLQEKDKNLKEAEEMSKTATEWARNEWKNPTEKKPATLTTTQWKKSLERNYGMYADSYAMINYKLGNYKKGFPYAQDAAIKIAKGQNVDENGTYALLAEKVLSPKKYIPQFEQFVRDGKSSDAIKEVLKKAFVAKHGEAAADTYISKLEKASYFKMMEDLRKGMLSDVAPVFTLVDLHGQKVSLSDLKNKVVIADFWATWCGPCKSSFPSMQKMVTKYKDDPNVKFVFIDTWENGEDNNKKHEDVSKFIAANKYDFHVLMDNDDKVVTDFKISGIPTKFIIDKKGIIRFKSVGWDGEDKLISELTSMIDIAKEM